MNPLLQQFITEARDLLEEAASGLLALETSPNDMDGVNAVFRAAHTLKGSTGLFDVLPMTHVVHAAEDILDAVKAGQVSIDSNLIDMLLDAFDQVGIWIDELENAEQLSKEAAHTGKEMSSKLRAWLVQARAGDSSDMLVQENMALSSQAEEREVVQQLVDMTPARKAIAWLSCLSPAVRLQAYQQGIAGHKVVAIAYTPEPECYFKGEDPFGLVLQIPGLIGLSVDNAHAVKVDAELDVYQANIQLYAVASADVGDIEHLFRYVSEQVMIEVPLPEEWLIPFGNQDNDSILLDISEQMQRYIEAQDIDGLVTAINAAKNIVPAGSWAANTFELMALVINTAGNHKLAWLHVLVKCLVTGDQPDWLSVSSHVNTATLAEEGMAVIQSLDEVDRESLSIVMGLQANILRLPIAHELYLGRIASIGKVIENVLHRFGHNALLVQWLAVVNKSKISNNSEGMLAWLEQSSLALVEPNSLSNKSNTRVSSFNRDAALALVDIQRQVLAQSQPEEVILLGRLRSVKTVLTSVLTLIGRKDLLSALNEAVDASAQVMSVSELVAFIDRLDLTVQPIQSSALQASTRPVHRGDPALLAAHAPSGKVGASDTSETATVHGDGIAKTLRVEQASIDKLGDLIGELVVAKNAMPYLAQRAEREFAVPELAKLLKEQFNVVDRLTQELQSTIMKVQMLPVSQIFQRFPRLVRDISRKLGKKINLVVEGEETQADKTVIEVMSDPMIHMVRNSLDHGIESPEERLAAGKSETGTIKLKAFQEGDSVIIEIQDDGRGVNPARVKQKALEKGLITEEQAESITDQEAVYLIFQPGFSTNDEVTDLSGRGVGMDVVRSTIERIGGTLRVHSEVGKGTIIRLSLPLSMAVSHVMEIELAHQVFGVPMDIVVETARLTPDRIKTIKQRETFIWRSRLVPLVRLRDVMQFPAGGTKAGGVESVLVVRRDGSLIGLVVDDFRSKSEVIMKPLEGPLSGIPIYAGSALLGDGSVMLVLNIGGIRL